MKRYITIILVVLGCLGGQGCSHFDDMNHNPYTTDDVSPASFIQTITFATQSKILSTSYNLTSQLMQHAIAKSSSETTTLVYNYECTISHTTTFWDLYIQKGNAEAMLAEAREDGDAALEGVALILRSYVMQIITDVYGDVPYFQAGLMPVESDNIETNLKYDSQKEIYMDMLLSLEKANDLLKGAKDFSEALDSVYGGKVASWRKLGNTLYLRLLMRISNKVIDEDGGNIDLGDEAYPPFDVKEKIAAIYNDNMNADGEHNKKSDKYPIFTSVADRAFVQYNTLLSTYYTPFYTTTNTLFKQIVACETMVKRMVIRDENEKIIMIDPRYYEYFTRAMGLPVQQTLQDVQEFWDKYENSIGTYATRLKQGTQYSLMNYSEPLFVFAEACCREYIPGGPQLTKTLYLKACKASMEEWNPDDVLENDYVKSREEYMDAIIESYDPSPEKALETIMWQKWIASFWYGVEAWSDYRRTGYPILKTNGPAALNNKILCTRMMYPYTEPYQNGKCYQEAVNGWLGGSDDMKTDVWFADTQESKRIRKEGQKK